VGGISERKGGGLDPHEIGGKEEALQDPFAVSPVPAPAGGVEDMVRGMIRSAAEAYPWMLLAAEVLFGASLLWWAAALWIPTRNPWWRWSGWLFAFGFGALFAVVRYLPIVEHYLLLAAGRAQLPGF